MNWKTESKIFVYLAATFLGIYFLPVGNVRFDNAVSESLELTKWYAREHVVLCLLPAFWIAGGIAAFVSQASVMRFLGPKAPKTLAYGVGAVSGTILAVCSCTVLPLFAGIYRMGAGLGPATAFLYSGPAINALAIILTAKVLGYQLGLARAFSAIIFSIAIGLIMAFLFRKEEQSKNVKAVQLSGEENSRPLWQTATFFGTLVGILVFSNWGGDANVAGFFSSIYRIKWIITSVLAVAFGIQLYCWYGLKAWKIGTVAVLILGTVVFVSDQAMWPFLVGILGLAWITAGEDGEAGEWFSQTWTYTKQIMLLLLGGVLFAGLALGRPGHEGLIPSAWIAEAVGGNSLAANAFASIAGAFMYFATLTEIPILQGLLGNGMGKGPALALLLAGPALSLPNMLVINSVIGPRKTCAYVGLVVVMATSTGWIYGAL